MPTPVSPSALKCYGSYSPTIFLPAALLKLKLAGIQPSALQVDPGSAVWVFIRWWESLRPVPPKLWSKGLGVSTETTVVFSVAVDRAGVCLLGLGLWFPTFWTDDFGDIVTTELAIHLFRDVFKQVRTDRFQEGILASRAVLSGGLFTHNCLHHWNETTWILGGDQLDFWRISPKVSIGI